MFEILRKEELSKNIFLMELHAPLIAKKVQSGQFLILRTDEDGERFPLTIADFNREAGTIVLIFQEVGASTRLMGQLEQGQSLHDLVGPLGQKTHIEKLGTVICVGGGIGVAPVYPIARGMKEKGNEVISIMGAKTKDILIFEDEMRAVSDEVFVTTDDGSYGIKGFVTTALQQIIDRGTKIAEVVAIGPVVMMRSVAEATRPYNIPTVVSLNPIMVDGTGMCGGCRVQIGDETKFACVDGPEFDAHKVDFKGLMARQRMYKEQEKDAVEHICRCEQLGLKKGDDCECQSH